MNRDSGERKEVGLRTAGLKKAKRMASYGNRPDGGSAGSEKGKKPLPSLHSELKRIKVGTRNSWGSRD